VSDADDIARLEALIEQLCRLEHRHFKILHGLINGQIEARLEARRGHSATRAVVFNAFADDRFAPQARGLTLIPRQTFGER
jgi:hypothetical protein